MLSWELDGNTEGLRQTAYEIMVATSIPDLLDGKRLVWKTRKKSGDESHNIYYKGKPLKPFTRYYWKVRVYNESNEASEWSEPTWFETSILQINDWKAQWIGDGTQAPVRDEDFYKDDPSPLFRKTFDIKKKVKEARLYIAGLGYYEASMNGKRIDDQVLDPGWTAYGKQILYSTYDVTSMIEQGQNVLGVILGNGFYNPIPMRIFRPLREFLTIGRPSLKAQLRIVYEDGSADMVITDTSWRTVPGPILKNSIYLGELYDANKEIESWDKPSFDDTAWKLASLADSPSGELTSQMQPPIRITEIIKPKRMTECRPGEFIFDMGQNFAGVVRIKVKGKKGTVVKIRYGEDVYSDGSLNVMTSVAGQVKKVWDANWDIPGQPQTAWQEDVYVLKGEGEEVWAPRFTFHGFRYVEVTGWPGRPTLNDIEGLRMNADLPRTGTFECSNEMFNKLNRAIDYTFLSNVFSVQSDCPAREKFGYGGDIVGIARTFLWYYDMENFYRKTIRDYANDQRPSGGMTETAPFNGIADQGLGEDSGPIGWQLAFGYMQKRLYEFYGDIRTIEQYYPTFRRQVEFLRSKAEDNIIDRCINDHESLEERIPSLFATAHYYHHVILLAEFAELTGRTKDVTEYKRFADDIKQSFIAKFIQPGTGKVGNSTQASQAIALYYNLLPNNEKENVLDILLSTIKQRDGHIAAGIFGVPAILEALQYNDRNDIAYEMVNKRTFPGWGHMIESGATTIWETWKYSDNIYSHNHPMFGSVGQWFYQTLLGINPASPGFKEIIIKPQPAGDLSWAKGSFHSIHGKIVSDWKIEDDTFILSVKIPGNTSATIYLPSVKKETLEKNGSKMNSDLINIEQGYSSIKVPAGEYSLSIKL
jgi:alpha-L-rhamnosidase